MSDIILHIGAHRSGSTGVEQTLSANGAAMKDAGIVIWRPAELRAMAEFGVARKRDVEAEDRAAFGAKVEAVGAGTLLISEENMIGSMEPNLTPGRFYPHAKRQLARHRDLMPEMPRRVGLGIRDYASYYVSVYTYVLAQREVPAWEEIAQGLVDSRKGWLDLVAATRKVFPDSELLIWPMHALKGRLRHVAARLVDVPVEALKPLRRKINPSLPVDAIPAALALRAAEPKLTRGALMARLAEMPAPEKGSFQPFTPAQRAQLDARYDADIAELKAGAYGVRFVTRAEVRAA